MTGDGNIDAIYRLTPMQEGILYHVLERGDPALYVGQYTAFLQGRVDPDRLIAAWQTVLQRHPSLRALYTWDELEAPLQVVRSDVTLPWQFVDLSELPETERAAQWRKLAAADREQGFDLERPPLLRLLLARLGPSEFQLSLCYHHIAIDGWSLRLLLTEIETLCSERAIAPPASTPPPFVDYVEHVLNRPTAPEREFWRAKLADFDTVTRLAPAQPTGDVGYASVCVDFGAEFVERLQASARTLRVTLNTLCCAAWALLLSRYCDHDDVVFGTTWAGRPSSPGGWQHAVGLFINTLPTRIQVADLDIATWVRSVQNQLTAMRQHELTPLGDTQKHASLPAGEALFDTIVVVQEAPTAPILDCPWHRDHETFDEYSNFPIALLIRPGRRFAVKLVHDRAAVRTEFAAQLLRHFRQALEQLCGDGARKLRSVSILGPAEHNTLQQFGRGPAVDFGSDDNVLDAISLVARARPEHTAVLQDDASLTYAELLARADAVASAIVERVPDASHSPLIGAVLLERTPDAVAALLGVQRAGGAYVALDPAYPPERLRTVLADVAAAGRPSVIVTSAQHGGLLGDVPMPVLNIETVGTTPVARAPRPIDADTDAYVVYTSGSTGRAKGVCVTHANLAASTQARGVYYREAPERFLLLSSLATDSSIAGLYWTLTTGGTLILPRVREEQTLHTLLDRIRRTGITHLLCLPSLYALLLEHAPADALATLRCVIVAGEACPQDLPSRHATVLPGCELHNEYGPSETTVWATAARLDPNTSITIGRPIANAAVRVLGRHGHLQPPNVPGELHIGGIGVARGYLNQADHTATRFVSDESDPTARWYKSGDLVAWSDDGELHFLGRTDHQVKVRGHRVELEEVQRHLRDHPDVRDAAVVLAQTPTRLAGFLVGTATSNAVRRWLAQRLPDFMIPATLTVLDAIPQTPAGKIDLAALARHTDDPPSGGVSVAPRNAAEATLAEIWANVLDRERVGVTENFFELGGDSLLSIRLLARAHQAGFDLSPAAFFAEPTIAAHARAAAGTATTIEPPTPTEPQPFDLVDLDDAAFAAIAEQLDDG
ncbi:MAG: amino acid adenylation domain-containing protein [Pseudomonadota bacterium]